MKRWFFILFCSGTLLLSSFVNLNDGRPAKVLHQMFDSIKNVKTLRMKIAALERADKKFLSANSEIKLRVAPRKVYFVNRTKKLEILYDSDVSSGKAWVKPHVFPYMTLHLDAMGNLLRKNQHYTIHELGFEFIGTSVAFTISKDKEALSHFKLHGRVLKQSVWCYLLEYENKSYSYMDYTVKERETVTGIAGRLCLNDYLIRYKNNLFNDFGYLKKGRVIKIPTLYCRKAVLYINEKTCLPVSVSLYDDAGLFESYEFTDVEINPSLNKSDFDKGNKEYNF